MAEAYLASSSASRSFAIWKHLMIVPAKPPNFADIRHLPFAFSAHPRA